MPRSTTKKRRDTKKVPRTRSAGRKAARRGAATPPPETPERPAADEEAAYTEALIESGQAARLDAHGKLPAGATHRIVEDDEGNVKVVRRRFSIT